MRSAFVLFPISSHILYSKIINVCTARIPICVISKSKEMKNLSTSALRGCGRRWKSGGGSLPVNGVSLVAPHCRRRGVQERARRKSAKDGKALDGRDPAPGCYYDLLRQMRTGMSRTLAQMGHQVRG